MQGQNNFHKISPTTTLLPRFLPDCPNSPPPRPPPSTMLPSLLLFFLLLPTQTLTVTLASSSSPPQPSVYEILPKYGLPPGLLPDTVTSYTLSANGSFSVYLAGPCYVQFDSYLVYYSARITGTLKVGSIRDLDGIEVRKLFVWLGVDEIQVDLPPSDYIYFHVGWITKKLDVDEFWTVHSCVDQGLLLAHLQPLQDKLEKTVLLAE